MNGIPSSVWPRTSPNRLCDKPSMSKARLRKSAITMPGMTIGSRISSFSVSLPANW